MTAIAPVTGIRAVTAARAERTNPTRDWTRLCQMFVRTRYDVGPGYATAIQAFRGAQRKHEDRSAPYGVCGYFAPPRAGQAGHAVLMAGGDRGWSNDIGTAGRISLTTIGEIEAKWTGFRWVGWCEDINGVRVWGHGPSISADAVKAAQKGDREHGHGRLIKRQLAAVPGIGKHGMRLTDDRLGHPFDDAVRDLQKRLGLNRTGLVGPRLLGWLADHQHAFTARP